MKKVLFGAMLYAFLFACQGNQVKPNLENYKAMNGKQVYDMYCVACHGADGKMAFSGAKDLSLSTLSLEERMLQISHGKGVMNAFKGVITEEEIKNVAIYIEELRIQQ